MDSKMETSIKITQVYNNICLKGQKLTAEDS